MIIQIIILFYKTNSLSFSPSFFQPAPIRNDFLYGFYGFLLSPHPRNKTANAMEIPATMRNRSAYVPKAAEAFSQESPAIRPA